MVLACAYARLMWNTRTSLECTWNTHSILAHSDQLPAGKKVVRQHRKFSAQDPGLGNLQTKKTPYIKKWKRHIIDQTTASSGIFKKKKVL
jgi:hypothetical protein